MKTTTMILMVAAGVALNVMGADSKRTPPANNTPSASATLQKPVKHIEYKLLPPKRPASSKIERIDGISSQPWAKAVGWSRPLFVDDRVFEPNFHLFWIGAKPD